MMQIPGDLRVVAYLFVLHGVLAIAKCLAALPRGNIRIDVGILCLFAGLGLLRLSTGWWKFAKFYTLIYLLLLPFAVLLLMRPNAIATANVMLLPVFNISKELAMLQCVLCWLVAFWEYGVLTGEKACSLFEPNGPQPADWK